MELRELFSDIEQLRRGWGLLTPQTPERSKTIRRILQLAEKIAQSTSEKSNTQDVLDRQAQILIEQAKKLAGDGLSKITHTLCQRELLSQAIAIVDQSGKLWRNYEEQYRDAYSEAWLKTLEYFYRHYGEYDPAIAQVATWLNFRLKNEFKTQQAKFHKCAEQTIQTTDPEDDSRDLLAMMVSPSYGSQAKLMKEEIEHWIAEDGELQTTTIKNRPEITAQGLLQKRFVEEGEWSKLARDYGTSIATLSSFYERQCRTRLIQFVETNFDFSPPDTPINPCEHLRGLSKQKRFGHLNFHDYLSEWVKSDPQLRTLTLRGKPEITARIVLEKLLITIQHPRQGLLQVAEALQVNPVELERFYEFRLMPLILEVVHKSFRNSR